MNAHNLVRLVIAVGCVGAILLIASCFIPAEGQIWSPYRMAFGYSIGGGNMSGWAVSIVEIGPFALGAAILVAGAVRKWPECSSFVLVSYAAVWLVAGAVYLVDLAGIPGLRYGRQWVWASIALIALFAAVFAALRGFGKRKLHYTSLLTLSLVLVAGSIIQQATGIAYYLLEDGMLLNVGAVTGEVGAVMLFISLLLLRQGKTFLDSVGRGLVCSNCFYDLRGSVESTVCPECGADIPEHAGMPEKEPGGPCPLDMGETIVYAQGYAQASSQI